MLNFIGGFSIALGVIAMIALAAHLSHEPNTFPDLCYRSGGTYDTVLKGCRWNMDHIK